MSGYALSTDASPRSLHPAPRDRRSAALLVRALALALTLFLGCLFIPATPALAHGGGLPVHVTIDPPVPQASAPLSLTLAVFHPDGLPARDLQLTASVVPGGTPSTGTSSADTPPAGTPPASAAAAPVVTLAPLEPGRYGGTVTLGEQARYLLVVTAHDEQSRWQGRFDLMTGQAPVGGLSPFVIELEVVETGLSRLSWELVALGLVAIAGAVLVRLRRRSRQRRAAG